MPIATAEPAATPAPPATGPSLQTTRATILAELSEFLGIRTNNYAEYSGLLGCLQYALDNHHPRLRVVSDSELMVKQIQGKYKVNSPDLKPLWQEARNRIAKLEGFEISHALRHKNKDADRLANEAMDRGMKRSHTAGQPSPASSQIHTLSQQNRDSDSTPTPRLAPCFAASPKMASSTFSATPPCLTAFSSKSSANKPYLLETPTPESFAYSIRKSIFAAFSSIFETEQYLLFERSTASSAAFFETAPPIQ